MLTQVELIQNGNDKVYWFEADEGNILPGDAMTLAEESGVWSVRRVFVTLPQPLVASLPHRIGTWRSLKRVKLAQN